VRWSCTPKALTIGEVVRWSCTPKALTIGEVVRWSCTPKALTNWSLGLELATTLGRNGPHVFNADSVGQDQTPICQRFQR
jgi:hypothetical protein